MKLYRIVPPKSGAETVEFFTALHGLLRPWHRRLLTRQLPLEFQLRGRDGSVFFSVAVPDEYERFVLNQLRGCSPGVEFYELEEQTKEWQAISYGRLATCRYLPIRTDGEGFGFIVEALSQASEHEEVMVSISLRPRSNGWRRLARAKGLKLRTGKPSDLQMILFGSPQHYKPTPHALEEAKAMEEKARFYGFTAVVKIKASSFSVPRAKALASDVARAFHTVSASNFLRFGRTITSCLLTAPEVAGLWHFPEQSPRIAKVVSPKLQPPREAPAQDRVIGIATYPGSERPVAIPLEDAFRHTHALGPTGVGKSTLLLNLALADIRAGRGVMVIDPKSDLVSAIMARIPPERVDDVILIRPEDSEYSIGLNPLEWKDPKDRELIIENTMSIFQRIYAPWYGIRTAEWLRATLMTLTVRPNSTLIEIPLLLSDEDFRRKFLDEIHDPFVQTAFWDPFDQMSSGQRNEQVGPLLTKLRDLISSPRIRRMVCQSRSTVDFGDVLRTGKIVLVDLAAGLWGETTSSLLGSFLITKLWQEARARGSLPEQDRRPFLLYVDEFQNFMSASISFADTLAQARSFRLGLVLANQHIGQLSESVRSGLSSNARSKIVFQLGLDDARWLAREFAPLDPDALMGLARYEFVGRISVHGETSKPFTARSLPPPPIDDAAVAQEIATRSIEKYGRPIKEIDDEFLSKFQSVNPPNGNGGKVEK